VDREWQETFRNRMRGFEARRAPGPGEAAVSIKVRVASGCFHREHSPRAYELIDRSLIKLAGSDGSFAFEEHESGPEILVYLALTTAGLSLAKSIIDLITAIIKARSEGIRKGDSPAHPVELIVRRVHDAQEFREETVLRIGHEDAVDEAKVERQLRDALRKLLKDEPSTRTPRKKN
jgi:hypothetical protein